EDIEYVQGSIDRVDLAASRVSLLNGATFEYDVLVIATGAVLLPEETEGLGADADNVFTFYSLDDAERLQRALSTFSSGRIAVNVVVMPIKCPVAPLEFCFLADW